MSGKPSSTQQKAGRQPGARARGGVSQKGGNPVEVYLHFVKDTQAALLAGSGSQSPIQDIKHKSGADVQLDPNPSPVQDTKTVIIHGSRLQIETAVRLINLKTGDQETLSEQAQTFWLQWVEATFPDLDSSFYFLPPVYVNRVPMTTQSAAGQDVLVLKSTPKQPASKPLSQLSIAASASVQTSIPQPPSVQYSDIRDDAAMQHVFLCLQELFKQEKEVLFAMTQLLFGEYLGKPCYAAAAAQLPLPASLPPVLPRTWKRGDFDFLLIHRHFGLIVCEVKAFGDNVQMLSMSQQDLDNNIRKKMTQAMSQLDKADAMLSHLVSDIAPGLRITKTIVFPNLTVSQVQQALVCVPQLTQDLCRCLGTTDPSNIAGLCLCCDQLSDPKTPWDVSSHVLRELGHWWQRRVAGAGPASQMTYEVYKTLVARFCGPATSVTVPCTCPPRVSVKTLGQAVWCTGECYTAVITLFPEQLHLLNTQPPRVFLAGPPGTGKTVVLLLMGLNWLRCGHHVYIVSTSDNSRAACIMLYHLLLHAVNTNPSAGASSGHLHYLTYNLYKLYQLRKAVSYLTKVARKRSLYVITDEVGSDYISGSRERSNFQTFYNNLLEHDKCLHLWAASCFHGHTPAGWQVEYLTRPLRSPPVVVREVEQNTLFTVGQVKPYDDRGVPNHTDGPPVKRLYHRGQDHTSLFIGDCVTCGRELARFLHRLRDDCSEIVTPTLTPATSTRGSTPLPCLQWKDMLMLSWRDVNDSSGIVTALREANIPVRVMKHDDSIDNINDLSTARSDVMWVVLGHNVCGLERKVVICTNFDNDDDDDDVIADDGDVRLFWMSRCTAQLIIVSR